jgi:hypothetical protein
MSGAASPLWIVGGEQKLTFVEQEEWNKFKTAVVSKVEGDRVERVFEYRSPPEHCPDDAASHLFKAATIEGDTIWLCTQTEVLECSFPDFTLRRTLSLPCFNDLHHVTPGPNGHLFIAVTGLDAVAEITRDGELVRLTDVLGGDVWDRFSRDVDYRKVPTTKPHLAHPNYVFFLDGRPWVTRFAQRDAVPLDGLGGEAGGRRPFPIEIEGCHDGNLDAEAPGRLCFTTVDGHLVRFDVRTGEREVTDFNGLTPDDDRPLGWCRGLLPFGDRAWVGFTRIRQTKLRQNLSWIRHGFREAPWERRPTRIALYDLEKPALLREIHLEDAGMNAVFSIHTANG